MPGTSTAVCQVPPGLADHKRLVARAAPVGPARAAVARRGARHGGRCTELLPYIPRVKSGVTT